MPTANPSIIASTGVVDVISTTSLSAKRPAAPPATVTIAIKSGRPAATNDPSVTSNTPSAIITPTISPTPKISLGTLLITSPPISTAKLSDRASATILSISAIVCLSIASTASDKLTVV